MVYDLSNDKDKLEILYRVCRTYPDKERLHALYIRSLGHSRKFVAELFCRDEDTIAEWERKWIEKQQVMNEPKSGAPKKFDKDIEKAVVKLADENNPKKYGVNASFWDCIELHKFFLANGLYIGRETIRRILKKNGFRYVKTDYQYALANEAAKASFLMELDLLIANREKGSTILFGDEMGAQLNPRKGYVWTRDKKPLVKTYPSRKKVNIVGAVNPLTGSHAEMMTSGKMGEKKFVEFLEKLCRKFRGDIYFFLDNFRIHKSKLVENWLKDHPRMNLLFLPAYSPDLNVIEWLWCYSRRKFLNNKLFTKTRQLTSSYSWFLRKLPKSTVKSVCNIDILLNRIT